MPRSFPEIHTLLPQREPYLLVDALTAFCAVPPTATCRYLVRPDTPLCHGGTLTPAALLEHIAQSCAARMGYLRSLRHDPPAAGLLAAVRSIDILRLPHVGETLTTTVRVVEETDTLTLLAAETLTEHGTAARAKLTTVSR